MAFIKDLVEDAVEAKSIFGKIKRWAQRSPGRRLMVIVAVASMTTGALLVRIEIMQKEARLESKADAKENIFFSDSIRLQAALDAVSLCADAKEGKKLKNLYCEKAEIQYKSTARPINDEEVSENLRLKAYGAMQNDLRHRIRVLDSDWKLSAMSREKRDELEELVSTRRYLDMYVFGVTIILFTLLYLLQPSKNPRPSIHRNSHLDCDAT